MEIIKSVLILLLSVFLILPKNINAQKTERKQERKAKKELKKENQTSFLILETAATYSNNQDLSTSNQLYNGPGTGLSLGKYKETPKTIRDYEILGLGANFISSQGGVSGYDFTVAMNYNYLFILDSKPNDWRIAVGSRLDFLTQVRVLLPLGNSGAHWDGLLTLGAAARVDKTILLPLIHKDVQFYSEAYLPITGYINRPSYGIPGWEVIHQFAYIGNMFRIETENGIIFPIGRNNNNAFRISYNWDFFRYRDNEVYRVITGHHALGFGLMVKLR